MKLLRLCVSLLFVIVLVTFVVFQFNQLKVDKTIPRITVDGDKIEVSLDATDADLLIGVSAYIFTVLAEDLQILNQKK